jgi:hypothetical protein
VIKIYKLLFNNEVIYIGKTKQKLTRRKNGGYGKTISRDFLKECSIELIEETDDVSRERYWIDHYLKQGCLLLNITKGDGLNYKEYRKEYYWNNKDYHKGYHKDYNKDYYLLNREKIIRKAKEYKSNNEESTKLYNKDYYLLNKEKLDKNIKEYNEKNKEKLKEYRKQYYLDKKNKNNGTNK